MLFQGLTLIILNLGLNFVIASGIPAVVPNTTENFFDGSLQDLMLLEDKLRDIPGPSARELVDTNVKFGNVSELWYYSNHAAAVHCSNDSLRNWDCIHCKNTGKLVVKHIIDEYKSKVRYFLGVDKVKKTIVLSIRGSANVSNMIYDFKFFFTNLLPDNHFIKVHRGFKQLNEKLSPSYIPRIEALVKEYPDYDIVVTGHSLGGALSTLAVIEINQKLDIPYERMQLYTMASPRVGNLSFALWFNSMPITIIRATSENDIVPHLPPRNFRFTHVIAEYWENDDQITVCNANTLEDSECSLSTQAHLSTKAHVLYLGKVFGKKC